MIQRRRPATNQVASQATNYEWSGREPGSPSRPWSASASSCGRTVCFLFCFESFIYNPLLAARRAMAAAVPLPSTGQRRGFLRYTHFLPRTSLRGYVEVTPFSFSPWYRQTKEKEIIMTTKEKQRKRHILDGWAWAPLISTRTDLGFHIFPHFS